ncbi:MAG: TonB-dependent siderophore receptor [Bryobacteraceae bacterium]|nr:TonB-dependent siderophore receptor [Bryobacteraceae bacterium]
MSLPAFLCLLSFFEPAPVTVLTGRVLDPTGAPVAEAKLESGRRTLAYTDQAGQFRVVLPAGPVRFTVSRDGFAPHESELTLPSSGLRLADIELQLLSVVGQVTVTESPGYQVAGTASATRTATLLLNLPQSIAVVTQEQMRDQLMLSIGDVVRFVPGITAQQGEGNRDQLMIRGQNTTADFFVNGVRDDAEYFRDLYNLERVEALKGPNAMTFGRGGGGGVINRVTKEALDVPRYEVNLQAGAFGHRRASADVNRPLNRFAAFRLNALYENSRSFRQYFYLERAGLSPTLTLHLTPRTRAVLQYEFFRDHRFADRGVTSVAGLPASVPLRTFFGNPDESRARADVNLGSATVEHQAGRLNLRNRTLFGHYDRFYQNFVPGVVNAASQVSLSSYNNATARLNAFNQTDATYALETGPIRHTLLTGVEVGRQASDNLRLTGYFDGVETAVLAPLAQPTIFTPLAFRPNATDANNRVQTNLAAVYVQDQIELNRFVQVIAGVRVDRFDLQFASRRNADRLGRLDTLVSPRAGVVVKPVARMSLYANYSVSYLPSSGDQFASLTVITQQVKPEKFQNYETGLKFDWSRALSLTAAVFRLDRTNTRSIDPNDPTRIIQTGSQRTNGVELSLNGNLTRKWRLTGGYAYLDAFVVSATAAARAGAQVAQVPRHAFSVWNHYQLLPRLGAGLGLLNRSDMFAGIDNTVVLPAYTRADAAVFFALTERLRLQANVENLFDRRYYLNAHTNTNISPGFPRTIRIGLTARF